MNWIKLTGAREGNELFVNMSLAHCISVIPSGEYRGMTNIDFSTTQSYCSVLVKETPEDIIEMMKS